MSQAINPNTAVTEESTAESKIGEATSFEQLDRITDDQISSERKSRRVPTKAKEIDMDNIPEDSSEEETSAEPEEALPEPTTPDADANIEPSMGINPETLKPIKIKYGEDTVELLPTSEIPIKVDGKEGTASLQDLRDNWSGKQAWDKKFNEINVEKQEFKKEQRKFQEEKQYVDERINKFYELSSEDPIKAFDFLCEISGKDPVEFQKTYRDNLAKQFEAYYNMDEIGRKEFDLDQRERYFQQRRQTETQRKEQEKQAQEEHAQLANVLETFGINEETYYDVRSDLSKAAPDQKVDVSHVIRYERALRAQKIVQEIRPDKAEDAQILGELATVLVQNPSFTDKDLREIVAEIWKDEPSQAQKDLSKKVLKTQTQAKKVQDSGQASSPAWNFDQI